MISSMYGYPIEKEEEFLLRNSFPSNRKGVASTRQGECRPKYNVNYDGHFKTIDASNWEDCGFACFHERGCTHWTFNIRGKCFLKGPANRGLKKNAQECI